MRLYHVSPDVNHRSILEHGIDPAFSRGNRKVSWYADEKALAWALAHCSARNGVPVDRLLVFAVEITPPGVKRTKWAGVYTCETTQRNLISVSSAESMIGIDEGEG